MPDVKLHANTRRDEDNVGDMRREGFIPAVIYGAGANRSVRVKKNDFDSAYRQVGMSGLIDLRVDDKDEMKVVVKDFQNDPVKGQVIHADFYEVDMNKAITVDISLHLVGEARPVKEEGGTLMQSLESVSAQCLPSKLVDFIEVDLSSIETFDDVIYVKDLKVPEGIEILSDPDTVVASVATVREEEEEPMPAEGEAAESEEKKEEEAAEGEKNIDGDDKKEGGKPAEGGKK